MYLSIIILPLLGSIVSGFFGRKIGVTGSHILTCSAVIATTLLAIIGYIEVGFNNNPVSITLFKWLDSESFNMSWTFQFDSLTVSMLIPVLIISSLVHFYSIGYMSHDPHNQRFFSYLSLFTFMMIILVTANNYLLMFVGWEGVGVCSYLLVSFWFTRIAANQSSMAAFLTNRVGDAFLTIGMFVILWSIGNLDYSTVFSLSPYINENIVVIIGICLLLGAMAKSSQLGLHIWLPMAMEGPTPVSALIHAATMVTAGVYLLIRSSPLIEYSSTILLICLWLGAITTVFSSLIGLFQQDIKKIIAYSTMSQLGMMVIAIGLSSYNVAIFHLINHAFYKGLLFLGAGAVIHAVADNQDLRKYGGLISFLPLTYTVILIASLSLVAFPFMTGFYSKDFILESAFGQYQFSSINVYFIAVIGAIFTTLYSVKVIYLTFIGTPNGSLNSYKNAHEGDIFLSLPLVILALFSIYFGFLTKDVYIGLGSGFFVDNSIFIHPIHEILIDTEFGVPTIFKWIPFICTIFFSGLALIYPEFMGSSIVEFKLKRIGYYIFGFFNQRFLIEYFYNKYIVDKVLLFGGHTTKVLDKGTVETVGPYGFKTVLMYTSKIISILSTGVVTDYALYILISTCFLLSIFSIFPILLGGIFNTVTVSCLFTLLTVNYYIDKYRSKDERIIYVGLESGLFNSYFLRIILSFFIFCIILTTLSVVIFTFFDFIHLYQEFFTDITTTNIYEQKEGMEIFYLGDNHENDINSINSIGNRNTINFMDQTPKDPRMDIKYISDDSIKTPKDPRMDIKYISDEQRMDIKYINNPSEPITNSTTPQNTTAQNTITAENSTTQNTTAQNTQNSSQNTTAQNTTTAQNSSQNTTTQNTITAENSTTQNTTAQNNTTSQNTPQNTTHNTITAESSSTAESSTVERSTGGEGRSRYRSRLVDVTKEDPICWYGGTTRYSELDDHMKAKHEVTVVQDIKSDLYTEYYKLVGKPVQQKIVSDKIKRIEQIGEEIHRWQRRNR